jgi:putative salt-induced outer membrane protein YdiY
LQLAPASNVIAGDRLAGSQHAVSALAEGWSRHLKTIMRLRLAVCVLALCPTLAWAQSAPPAPDPPPPAHEGSVDFAFVGVTGNASSQTIGLGGELILRPNLWVVRNKAVFLRNESDSVLSAESFTYLFRADRTLNERTSAFGSYNFLRDEFAGVESHNEVTGGIAYKLIALETQTLSVDGGFGYLNEHRVTGPDVSSGTYALGGSYKWKLSATAEISDDARFTGVFAQASDWRLDQTLAVTARLTGLLSLKASNSVRYANAPVQGFKNTDTKTAIALVAKF